MTKIHHRPNLLLGVLFLLMLALAAIIYLTQSDIATRILVLLIPLAGVALGVTVVFEAESTAELFPATILTLSAVAATVLAVIGAGPFSNLFVNLAIIGSIAGVRYNRPVRISIQKMQELTG